LKDALSFVNQKTTLASFIGLKSHFLYDEFVEFEAKIQRKDSTAEKRIIFSTAPKQTLKRNLKCQSTHKNIKFKLRRTGPTG